MEKGTTHIRITVATKRRLDGEIARLVAATRRGASDAAPADGNNHPAFAGMSYDQIINHLIDLDARKRERGRESAARRRQRPEQDHDPVVSNHGGEE